MVAAVFGVAWWTVWRGRPSARGWAIVASMINIAVSLWPIVFFSRSVGSDFAVLLAIGLAGLAAFWRRYEQPKPAERTQEVPRIKGDRTNSIFDKIADFLVFIASLGVCAWWLRWLQAKGVLVGDSGWRLLVVVLLVFLAIATLHEFGHLATGLALGMRLRAFIVGPFRWLIRDGRWGFEFKPEGILSPEGATGIVPSRADFPRSGLICMVAAGPLVNLLTGAFTLWIVFWELGSITETRGALALFGGLSLTIGVFNLLPLRLKVNYSDGATICQLLSRGPWGDFHRVAGVVGSSLVTPLRPRNYDIKAILRAAHGIRQGINGLLLRLVAYTYFLDQGMDSEAGEMLREAESIYHQCSSEIRAELCAEFVFGSAYVLCDAVAARQWWTRMEAKKATRFNVDYWRAKSALQWIEGNLKEANESWQKANALAQQLPKAGAYEFDRYCCWKLRQALTETDRNGN